MAWLCPPKMMILLPKVTMLWKALPSGSASSVLAEVRGRLSLVREL